MKIAEMNKDEARLLKLLLAGNRKSYLALRDQFQPDTQTYKDAQRGAELADNMLAEVLRYE